jgi:hypothetical protein
MQNLLRFDTQASMTILYNLVFFYKKHTSLFCRTVIDEEIKIYQTSTTGAVFIDTTLHFRRNLQMGPLW